MWFFHLWIISAWQPHNPHLHQHTSIPVARGKTSCYTCFTQIQSELKNVGLCMCACVCVKVWHWVMKQAWPETYIYVPCVSSSICFCWQRELVSYNKKYQSTESWRKLSVGLGGVTIKNIAVNVSDSQFVLSNNCYHWRWCVGVRSRQFLVHCLKLSVNCKSTVWTLRPVVHVCRHVVTTPCDLTGSEVMTSSASDCCFHFALICA